MITYNHEAYIQEAIDGVLMQKTDFPIELVIGEDCSTDKTREICCEYQMKYPNIIKLLLPEKNIGMQQNSYNVLMACTGKYIALCEGDDYWTDPYKLQKQVNFLESHSEYGIVNSDVNVLYQETGQYIKNYNKELSNKYFDNGIIPIQMILDGKYRIMTATVLLRKEILFNYIKSDEYIYVSTHFPMGDTPTWIFFAQNSKLHYIDDVTTVYRKNVGSLSRPNSITKKISFALSSIELRMYYINIYESQFDIKFIQRIRKVYQRRVLQYISFYPSYLPLFELEGTTKKQIRRIQRHIVICLLYRLFYFAIIKLRWR
jgi:glycosyltransferase involved in cell wall biosynthesis